MTKPKTEESKKDKGIIWSFKRILVIGIVIAAIGILIVSGTGEKAIRSEISKSWGELSSSIRERMKAQQDFGIWVIIAGIGVVAGAFIYRGVKLGKLENLENLQKALGASKGNNLDKIAELKKLLDDGALTEEEYEQKKTGVTQKDLA